MKNIYYVEHTLIYQNGRKLLLFVESLPNLYIMWIDKNVSIFSKIKVMS